MAVPGDVADPALAERAVSAALSEFGRLDVLVNNAGGVRDRTLLKMSDEEFDEVIAAHVRGPFLLTRACARAMRDRGEGGTIINIGSDSGLLGAFGQTNYAAAKGAVLGMTLTWARELERYGITCNCVLPERADGDDRGAAGHCSRRTGTGRPSTSRARSARPPRSRR